MFQTTKIQTFESNSQRRFCRYYTAICCFRLQRYKLLKAIHNNLWASSTPSCVVSDYKDTNFWKQFTTEHVKVLTTLGCFRLQRYKLLKAIHNSTKRVIGCWYVVSDYKDTNFWKQFTTMMLNNNIFLELFQTTKIQTFESNSQQWCWITIYFSSCFRLQRYKLLKAIHNSLKPFLRSVSVVSDYKDTNFWKQFTTYRNGAYCTWMLFQTTKIQTFESNSQLFRFLIILYRRCFRLQRYKLLKV